MRQNPPPSLIWRFGVWLLKWEARRALLTRAKASARTWQISFEMQKMYRKGTY